MHPPQNLSRIVNRKRYAVATSTLLAGDDWWDGHNFERSGRNQFLYRTRQGNYFTVDLSQWQGEAYETLEPVSQDEAIELFEDSLRERRVEYDEAFPDVTVADA